MFFMFLCISSPYLIIDVAMCVGPLLMSQVLLLLIEGPNWNGVVPHELVSPLLLDAKKKLGLFLSYNGCTRYYRRVL